MPYLFLKVMAKSFDHYSSFKIETVQPKPPRKRRRFKLSMLLWLILAWALLLLWSERAGSLSGLFQ